MAPPKARARAAEDDDEEQGLLLQPLWSPSSAGGGGGGGGERDSAAAGATRSAGSAAAAPQPAPKVAPPKGAPSAAKAASAAGDSVNAKKPIYAIARRLLSFAAEDRTLITVGALLIVVSSAAETAIPNYSARALAAIIADAGAEVAPPLPGAAAASGAPLSFPTSLRGFVVTALLAAITTGGRVWCTAITEVRLVARIQQRLFDAIIRQDVAFFDAKSSGELTSRLTSDVNVLSVSLTTNLNLIVQNSVNLTGSLVMMFGTQPKLAAVFAVASVLFFWGSKKFGEATRSMQKDIQEATSAANGTATQAISLLRLVRCFSAEAHESDVYAGFVARLLALQSKIKFAYTVYVPVVSAFNNALLLGVLLYGRRHVVTPSAAAGFAAFVAYTTRIQSCMSTISGQWASFAAAMGAGEAVFDLMDRVPASPESAGGLVPTAPARGALTLEAVSFGYAARPAVLAGVSLSLAPGQRIAVVGLSGSGKSTIVGLALRMYAPTGGRLLLDGHDIAGLDPTHLRRVVTAVQQEPPLFALSVRDNITYNVRGGAPSAEDVAAACTVADLDAVLADLPDGLDTVVGERGVRLSGGQKQRVAIARAVVRRPLLLALDEATSALDAASERRVQTALESHLSSRTPPCGLLVVAHRLSTVRNAQLIVVLHRGAVREQGTHDELISRGGIYRNLVQHQLQAQQLEGAGEVGADAGAEASSAAGGV